jgi:hypothetical protein
LLRISSMTERSSSVKCSSVWRMIKLQYAKWR